MTLVRFQYEPVSLDVLNLSQRLDLNSSNKYVALQNLTIYYTWKKIRKHYTNNNR